jgi:uncharacterized repeat protein (TIGR02543 family)
MKKICSFFIGLGLMVVMIFSLSACGDNAKPSSYYINGEGNLIEVLDDGNENNLGSWGEDIISSFKNITISDDGYYVIDGIKTKITLDESFVKGVSSIEISDDGFYIVNGVKTNISAINVYTVSFDTGFSTKVQDQKVKEGYKVEKPSISRTGYEFDGWFYNDEAWSFNSNTVTSDMTLVAHWTANSYTVKFNNTKGDNPADATYTYESNVTLPTVSSVAGYTMSGWYNGNTQVLNGKWTIAEDVTLTTRWTANSYRITLDPNGGNVSSTTANVTYGENYTLPVPTNSFGAFKGWYYGDEKVTDATGKSLAPYTYTSNITLTTNWIEEISTAEQLKTIASGLNGHYKLVADIDLENVEWTVIGSTQTPFTGVFDGNGYKIKNLTIDSVSGTEVGLFGCSSGTIKNLILEDVNINLGTINSDSYVAALVATNKGTIDNVTSSGTVTIANHSATLTSYVAGVVSKNLGSLKYITNGINVSGGTYTGGVCSYDESTDANIAGLRLINNGDVVGLQIAGGVYAYSKQKTYSYMKNTGSVTAVNNAGGIVGVNTAAINSPVTFKFCVNTGAIKSTDNNHGTSYAGGFTSEAYEVSVSDSYNTGLITGFYKGGLIGYNIGTGSYTRVLNTASCQYGFAYYMGNGSTIYDSMDYGTSNYATGYATVTNSYHNKPSDFSFYKDTLFWSDTVWDFSGTTYPTLKWESQ